MGSPIVLPQRLNLARVRALEVDAQDLVDMLKTADGQAIRFTGMPADAHVVAFRTPKWAAGKVVLVVESQEFSLVDTDTQHLPALDIVAFSMTVKGPGQEAAEPGLTEDAIQDKIAEQEDIERRKYAPESVDAQ